MMRKYRFVPIVVCMLAVSSLARAEFLGKDDISATIALLSAPPADGSPEQKAEIQQLLDIQAKRTPADVARAKKHADLTGFSFSEVLGPWFTQSELPVTARLLIDAAVEAKSVTSPAKKKFQRQRPFVADDRIHPAIAESGFSFPSGHATSATVYALVLAELFPEHKDELIALSKQIGEDREVLGVHYPSDVAAGEKIGAEIAKRLLANPDFHAEMEKAVDEIHADSFAGK